MCVCVCPNVTLFIMGVRVKIKSLVWIWDFNGLGRFKIDGPMLGGVIKGQVY